MTPLQKSLAITIIKDLQEASWSGEAISGFIAAEQIHGLLDRSTPHWKVKAYANAWPRFKPTSPPDSVLNDNAWRNLLSSHKSKPPHKVDQQRPDQSHN